MRSFPRLSMPARPGEEAGGLGASIQGEEVRDGQTVLRDRAGLVEAYGVDGGSVLYRLEPRDDGPFARKLEGAHGLHNCEHRRKGDRHGAHEENHHEGEDDHRVHAKSQGIAGHQYRSGKAEIHHDPHDAEHDLFLVRFWLCAFHKPGGFSQIRFGSGLGDQTAGLASPDRGSRVKPAAPPEFHRQGFAGEGGLIHRELTFQDERASAGTTSPSFTDIMSPGTVSRAGRDIHSSSRRTRTEMASLCLSRLTAFCESLAWRYPMTALTERRAKIIPTSTTWPRRKERAMAASRSHGMGPQYLTRNSSKGLRFLPMISL